MRVFGPSGFYVNNSNYGGNLKMNRLIPKSTLVSVLTAGLVLLLSACGGGGSSSGGGGAITGTILQGNVSSIGGGQAVFIQHMPGFSVERVAKLITDSVISAAHAAHGGTEGVGVCVEGRCTTTGPDGDFRLDLTGLAAGIYPITFTYNGVTYTGEITIRVDHYVVANVTINEDTRVVTIATEDSDVAFTEPETETKGNNVVVTICHKPGTPAQKTKSLPEPAIPGHLDHGDTLGACSDGPTVADTDGEGTEEG